MAAQDGTLQALNVGDVKGNSLSTRGDRPVPPPRPSLLKKLSSSKAEINVHLAKNLDDVKTPECILVGKPKTYSFADLSANVRIATQKNNGPQIPAKTEDAAHPKSDVLETSEHPSSSSTAPTRASNGASYFVRQRFTGAAAVEKLRARQV